MQEIVERMQAVEEEMKDTIDTLACYAVVVVDDETCNWVLAD